MKKVMLAAALWAATVLGASAQQTGGQGQPQGQNQAFCMNTGGGAMNCGFATMAQCDEARKAVSAATCTQNPKMTTGGPAPATAPPAGTGTNERGSAPGTGTSTAPQR